MNINLRKLQQFAIASSLAGGLAAAGVAASAQTIVPAAATTMTMGTAETATAAAPMAKASAASMSTFDAKANRAAEVERNSDEVRRTVFRNLGTSL